jgi:predicted Holliday junction resolvase-like endonuclease
MNLKNEAKEIIKMLGKDNFYAECPCCGESIQLKKAGLFYLNDFTPEAEALYNQRIAEIKTREKELKEERKKIKERSEVGAKTVNIGFILERLAPSLKHFKFNKNDCRSLFEPIDYLIFEGLSQKRTVTKLLFVDIKTGESRLKSIQKEIKNCIEHKKVALDTYKTEAK